jgi:pimeloyl-ACP methyl ester carboxylesterase
VAIIKFGALGVGPATKATRRGDMDLALRLFGRATLGRQVFDRLSQARTNFIKTELLGSGLAPLADDALRQIAMPTLLVTGQSSPALFHYLIDRLQELLPQTERVEIPEAAHIMHEDNPSGYNTAVQGFLAQHHATAELNPTLDGPETKR